MIIAITATANAADHGMRGSEAELWEKNNRENPEGLLLIYSNYTYTYDPCAIHMLL